MTIHDFGRIKWNKLENLCIIGLNITFNINLVKYSNTKDAAETSRRGLGN